MLLLFPETVPGVVPEYRSVETKAFVYGHSVDLTFEGFEILRALCKGGFGDYERAIYEVWGRAAERGEGFMILEQDVVPPSVHFMGEMARCPEKFCGVPVEDHDMRPEHAAMRYEGSPWSCSAGTPGCRPGPTSFRQTPGAISAIHPEDDYAKSTASAILKVGPALTQRPLDLGAGVSVLDSRILGFLTGNGLVRNVHLHWPTGRQLVKHNHLVCTGDFA